MGDTTTVDQTGAPLAHSWSQRQESYEKRHLRLRHHTSPSWLSEANPPYVCYRTKPGLSSILHFLKPPSASLYRHRVVYDTAAKITSHSGYPSEYTLSITAYRHCAAARQPVANTRTPPGPLAGIRRLTDPIYEPPEAQLSKRYSIPTPLLSQ